MIILQCFKQTIGSCFRDSSDAKCDEDSSVSCPSKCHDIALIFLIEVLHHPECFKLCRGTYDGGQLVITLGVSLSAYEKRRRKKCIHQLMCFKLCSSLSDRPREAKVIETHSSQSGQKQASNTHRNATQTTK